MMKRRMLWVLCSLWVTGMQSSYTPATIPTNKHVYFVVLAGGNGERLWPLSRQSKPKQLLTLSGDKTLLEEAFMRVEPLAESVDNLWVVTTRMHTPEITRCLGKNVGHILTEPASRNTGPAILYCCMKLYEKDPDAVVVFLPADPFIPKYENDRFRKYLQTAIDFVTANEVIALLGVRPTYPATGYGYIEFDQEKHDWSGGPYKVSQFKEKPSCKIAQEYVQQKNMLWNIGMFCGKVSVFLEEFKNEVPSLYVDVETFCAGNASYDSIESISVDYALIERTAKTWVLPVDFSWCDVGNVGVFLSLKKEFNESYHVNLSDNLIQIDSCNNLIDVPDNQVVALVGVDDLCIVQTKDALLITRHDSAEKVKAVVHQLKKNEQADYL